MHNLFTIICPALSLSLPSPATCSIVCKLGCVPALVPIIGHPTPSSRQLASDLLLLLSYHPSTHQLIKDTDMLPACLK